MKVEAVIKLLQALAKDHPGIEIMAQPITEDAIVNDLIALSVGDYGVKDEEIVATIFGLSQEILDRVTKEDGKLRPVNLRTAND